MFRQLQSLKRIFLNRGAYLISYFRLQKILKKVGPGSLVIDCGANIGEISALFLARGADVIAFEPDPVALEALRRRVGDHPRLTLYQQAVSDRSGRASFFFHKDRSDGTDEAAFTVSSTLVAEKRNVDTRHSIEVELIDLDAFIASLDRQVDVLKMDVEGAEIAILWKMLESGSYQKIRLMLVETHETKIPGHLEEVTRLQARINQLGIKHIRLNWI
jgi:FkbM family methyltransferase